MTPTIRLENADCLDFVRALKPASVDLIVTSPPYFIGKEYDRSNSRADFQAEIARMLRPLKRVLKPGGSICWQVGYHVDNGDILPLDWCIQNVFARHKSFALRNRIAWTFGHGEHCTHRFSGRHETILWYSYGAAPRFDLDAVRVPQKYPGKRHYRGPNKGEYSGNPLGKNPGDVWEIPNVKANHIEKTDHPCQFPVALAERLIRAICPAGGTVLDPYMGSGTTGVAALLSERNFLGCDINAGYVEIAHSRIENARNGTLKVRADKPIYIPSQNSAVARRPEHFAAAPEQEEPSSAGIAA